MDLLKFTIDLAEKAGKIILATEKTHIRISKKSKYDLVTNADKASEKFIMEQIKKHYPDHEILSEEDFFKNKKIPNAEYVWIIDPLDGTTNFAHGLPIFSISIALVHTKKIKSSKNFEYMHGEIIVGVVHAPKMYETFYAAKDKGAYLNGKRIRTSAVKNLENALMVTGFPVSHKKVNVPHFIKMLPRCQALRRLGSAALDLCYIACGRFDSYWEFRLKAWDIAAGSLIVEEAGGVVTDTNGKTLDLFGQDILATNGFLHKEVVKIFSKL
ncbi:MAG: inositol monophosphatase family protein [Candidatus Peregrinibacteria bacterium]|nr:inositol monophosphatase family protein [Candidatus Peregrinibacteria bacterium]